MILFFYYYYYINIFLHDGEDRAMHSKSDNIEIMISDEANEVTKKFFDSLKNRYRNNLELMRASEIVFDYVQLLYYKCHKINLNRGGWYIDSPDWIKTKKQKWIPSIKKLTTVTIALNYEEIKKNHPQRITKIKFFINKYNWKGINYSSENDDWKKFEKNNVTIDLNVLYAKIEKIYPAFVKSKLFF